MSDQEKRTLTVSVGMTIRLRSGGPAMVIEEFKYAFVQAGMNHAPEREIDRVVCVWTDDTGKPYRYAFKPAVLVEH